jgi:hypothetical protein
MEIAINALYPPYKKHTFREESVEQQDLTGEIGSLGEPQNKGLNQGKVPMGTNRWGGGGGPPPRPQAGASAPPELRRSRMTLPPHKALATQRNHKLPRARATHHEVTLVLGRWRRPQT